MRKFLIIALILGFVLSGCTTIDPDHDTTNTLDSHLSEPSEDWSSQTDPTDDLEGIASGPVTSDPTLPISTVPDSPENCTEGTEPAGYVDETDSTETQSPQQATETPTTPIEPTEVTKPTQTPPPETTPTQPAEPEMEETDQPKEIVDASRKHCWGNSHIQNELTSIVWKEKKLFIFHLIFKLALVIFFLIPKPFCLHPISSQALEGGK